MKRRDFLFWLAAAPLLPACDNIRQSLAGLQQDRGGAVLILEPDLAALRDRRLDGLLDEMADGLRRAEPAIRFSGRGRLNGIARIRPTEPADTERALNALAELARPASEVAPLFSVSIADDGFIEARLTPATLSALNSEALEATVAVLGRRLDPLQLGRVRVERHRDQIVVAAFDGTAPDTLTARIGPVGQLTFHLVHESERPFIGTIFAEPHTDFVDTGEFVERRPRLTGERLSRVMPTTNQLTGEMALNFQLDADGASTFCKLTREHVGERFAILLDNKVLTAPRIAEPICAGSGQISGNFTAQTATELATMLNAGALPAPVSVLSAAMRAPEAPLPWVESAP